MRTLFCPHCKAAILFSWGDFFILNNRGDAPLHCLGCKRKCTINSSAGGLALLASVLVVCVPVYVVLLSELFFIPGWFRAVALLVAVPVFMGVRGWFIVLFANKLVTY
jgi:hypothetical protein